MLRTSWMQLLLYGMLINYFEGSNIDEDYLLENEPFDEKGITFFKLLEVYKKYLKGYDEEKEVFTLADPYGVYKTIGEDEFFDAVSFRNDCLPEFIKKAMPSNAMIRFSKRI